MKRQETQQGLLPSGYRRLEYLESTGTQYIETDLYPDNTYTFDATVAKTRDINTVWFGVRSYGSWDTLNEQCYLNSNVSSNPDTVIIKLYSTIYTDTSNWSSGITPTLNTMYTLTNMTVVPSMHTMRYKLPLFAFNIIGTINTSVGIGKISHFTAYSSSVVVCDLLPVIRISDSKPGMYDIIGQQFLTNAGIGEFLYE